MRGDGPAGELRGEAEVVEVGPAGDLACGGVDRDGAGGAWPLRPASVTVQAVPGLAGGLMSIIGALMMSARAIRAAVS